jgi:hypothetical protein
MTEEDIYYLYAYFLNQKREFNGKDMELLSIIIADIPIFSKFLCKYVNGRLDVVKTEEIDIAKESGLNPERVSKPLLWKQILTIVSRKELYDMPLYGNSGIKVKDFWEIFKKVIDGENRNGEKEGYMFLLSPSYINKLVNKLIHTKHVNLFHFEGNLDKLIDEGRKCITNTYVFGRVPYNVELILYNFRNGKIEGHSQLLVSKGENLSAFIVPSVKLKGLRLLSSNVLIIIDNKKQEVSLPEDKLRDKPMDGWNVCIVFNRREKCLEILLENKDVSFNFPLEM